MVYTPKVGDYITWKVSADDDAESRWGKVKTVKGSSVTVTPYDEKDKSEKDGLTQSLSAYFDIKSSQWARMKIRAKPNGIELAENIAFASAYHGLLKKNALFGPENLSFALADASHEFLIKGLAESMMNMLGPSVLTKDGDSFFQSADFTDALRKVPFVVLLQQTFQTMIWRKPFSHQIMSNMFGDFGILSVSNFADRMYNANTSETPQYKYP